MTGTLLATALTGTARHPRTTVATGTPVDPLITRLPSPDTERTLLLAAGATAIYRQAGQRADLASGPPVPCPPEMLPLLPARQALIISQLLSNRYPTVLIEDEPAARAHPVNLEIQALLPEALALVARTGRLLPPQLLPQALGPQRSDTLSAIREALLPVLGERGRWLANFNPAWRWACASPPIVDTDLQAAWQEGTPSERLAALLQCRTTDPDQARGWLEGTWKTEKAEFRHDALVALMTKLSPADESFLEATLDDRAERVRVLASRLLARLPGSALARRMRERADAILSFDPRIAQITVTVPANIDSIWQRDSIAPASPWERVLVQILTTIPPSHWTARFGHSPNFLAAAARSDHAEALLEGWSRAALLHEDRTWAGALWDQWQPTHAHTTDGYRIRREMLVALTQLLPAEDAEQRMTAVLAGDTLEEDPWSTVLRSLPRPWGVTLSTACLEGLPAFLRTMQPVQAIARGFWIENLSLIAFAIAPACFTRALQISDLLENGERRAEIEARTITHRTLTTQIDSFAETIRLRRALYQELGRE